MWEIFSTNRNVIGSFKGHMSEAYRKKSFSINLAFFLLIIFSFTFINLIFIKNISSIDQEISASQLIDNSFIENTFFENHNSKDLFEIEGNFEESNFFRDKSIENRLILFGLNLLFFVIVIYTIGSLTFTINSIRSIEDQFFDQLEKNNELKKHFKEKSKYIRHRFKRKLIDLKSKKNIFVNSIKGFIDEHMGDSESSIYTNDLKDLRLNLHMNNIGTWTWDVQKDIVTIDTASYKILNLKKSVFAGGYSLFLNFFDKSSIRKLKKDIAYSLKFNTAFETRCSMKLPVKDKGLLIKGNVLFDSEHKAKKVQGILMQTECPTRSSNIQKQFLNQPIALFAILDKDFCFEFLNPAWLDSTGYSIHELKKYPMFNFIHQREKRLFLNNLHVLKQDNDSSVKNLKYRFRLGDGNFLNMSMIVSYENYRYYIVSNPVVEKKVSPQANFDFNLEESWDQQYLKS